MQRFVPLNRAELLVLMAVWLCLGIAIGAFAATAPHLTALSIVGFLLGMTAFVALAIYRANKEWRIKTTQVATH